MMKWVLVFFGLKKKSIETFDVRNETEYPNDNLIEKNELKNIFLFLSN